MRRDPTARRSTLVSGDGQLQGEAGQTEGGGEGEWDGKPREAAEEIAWSRVVDGGA